MSITLMVGSRTYLKANVQLSGHGYGQTTTMFNFVTTNAAIAALLDNSGASQSSISNLGGSVEILGVGAGTATVTVTMGSSSITGNATINVSTNDLANVMGVSLTGI